MDLPERGERPLPQRHGDESREALPRRTLPAFAKVDATCSYDVFLAPLSNASGARLQAWPSSMRFSCSRSDIFIIFRGAVYKVEDALGGNRLLAIKEINLSALNRYYLTCHTWTVLSSLPEVRSLPSGDHTTVFTLSVCPW